MQDIPTKCNEWKTFTYVYIMSQFHAFTNAIVHTKLQD